MGYKKVSAEISFWGNFWIPELASNTIQSGISKSLYADFTFTSIKLHGK